MSDEKAYSDLPRLPKQCRRRCGGEHHFYVAMSLTLNERVLEDKAGGLNLYVFKAGSTAACWDRVAGLNKFKWDGPPKEGYFDKPAYAGCQDWKILRCWDVPVDRYDDNGFKTWLDTRPYDEDVRHAGWRRFQGVEGLDPKRPFKDLCVMSEDFVRRRSRVRANHPFHNEVLCAVADAVIMVGEEFAKARLSL